MPDSVEHVTAGADTRLRPAVARVVPKVGTCVARVGSAARSLPIRVDRVCKEGTVECYPANRWKNGLE